MYCIDCPLCVVCVCDQSCLSIHWVQGDCEEMKRRYKQLLTYIKVTEGVQRAHKYLNTNP